MKVKIYTFILSLIFWSCNTKTNNINDELLNSPSLYVQMHSSNPINWHIWSDEIWGNAKKQNKLVLLSIGYSACHWCHVMEEESFTDSSVAKIMNTNYYSVKIDREQYPDADYYYANIQKELTGWAGWPMHFILNSDKKIIWTGIYLKKEDWKRLLVKISKSYKQNPDTLFINTFNEIKNNSHNSDTTIIFNKINQQIISKADLLQGGLLPTHYSRKYPNTLLLRYILNQYYYTKNDTLGDFLKTTLTKMYYGGYFDQIEAGFFRFSMDEYWHIPHFEKMLYTNTELISLYADAYLVFKNKEFKTCATRTCDFLIDNLQSENKLFYSSLDADTENEGSYYIYSKKEIKTALVSEYKYAKLYFNINEQNSWQSKYHLFKNISDDNFAAQNKLSIDKWLEIKKNVTKKLLKIRQHRAKPRRDNKLITSWNSLMIEALLKVWKISNNKNYLDKAEDIITFYRQKYSETKTLKHFYLDNGISGKEVFQEDYLYLIKSLIEHYRVKFDENSLLFAKKLYAKYLNTNFNIRFPKTDENLPSYFAMELYITNALNFYFNESYKATKINQEKIIAEPEKYGSVLSLLYNKEYFNYELKIALSNKNNKKLKTLLSNNYLPNFKIAIKKRKTKLKCLNGVETINDNTIYYFCKDNYCEKPTNDFKLIKKLLFEY